MAKHARSQRSAKARKAASRPRARARPTAEIARLEAELAVMRARVADLESRLERDPLTDLLNRRGFERELARALSYLQRYGGNAALIYLDLDAFKPVNDHHGHAAGDAVLNAIAATLLAAVRASDAVARIGGDEFALLLWNLSARAAQKKAAALEGAIAETVVAWQGNTLAVGASSGVAALAPDREIADLVGSADAAMYARKRERKAESGDPV